ncbi:cation:proton antiporter [Cucumibacter marinus]|uniref:cation:proton antiporter n=1 Tax=Cucumibacter marinus TaxID=1121252 RepID=UPI00040E4EB2|nr:sodium:proton antiporter [Cucumibacter marinus]
MLSLLEITALLLGLSGLFGWVNHRYFHLPHTIGLVIIALLASFVVIAIDAIDPSSPVREVTTSALNSIDFDKTLMDGMLSFLLFAGALHVDFSQLASQRLVIGIMATVGVVFSTFVIGIVTWAAFAFFGVDLPFIWALVFGALISPTDPVAVLGILKTVKVPASLEAQIGGESLFNDGVGVVVFTIILTIALGTGAHGPAEPVTALTILQLFVVEAGGGALLGIVGGYIAYRLMRVIDAHMIEVLLTLALVTAIYAIALRLHLSGPIAVVIAGLFIGNHGARFAMSDQTRTHVFQFWELIDEILNSVLFLLIGLEVLVVVLEPNLIGLALLSIPVVLLARFSAVFITIKFLSIRANFLPGVIRILTWGGLRGGISVALALSLPEGPYKQPILLITYAVVVFSIIVQGLTIRPVIARVLPEERQNV